MSTYELALAAKDKFKEEYWKKTPDKFNIIGLDVDFLFDFFDDNDLQAESSTNEREEYCVVAYLYDINDCNDLPKMIDGVEIRYKPVIDDMEKVV